MQYVSCQKVLCCEKVSMQCKPVGAQYKNVAGTMSQLHQHSLMAQFGRHLVNWRQIARLGNQRRRDTSDKRPAYSCPIGRRPPAAASGASWARRRQRECNQPALHEFRAARAYRSKQVGPLEHDSQLAWSRSGFSWLDRPHTLRINVYIQSLKNEPSIQIHNNN